MQKKSSLIKKSKKVAAEVGEAAAGAVKAVVRAAQSKLSPSKTKSRKRSVAAKRPKATQSKARRTKRNSSAKAKARRKS